MMERVNKVLILISIVLFIGLCVCFFGMAKYNEKLTHKIEFYEKESVRTGEVIAVFKSHIFVLDTFKEQAIEVNIYKELMHCEIEIGDFALYIVNYEYNNADLVNVIKHQDMHIY